MSSFTRTVARNSTFGMAAQLATKLLSFGFSVVIVRHLGVDAYGQYAAVLAFGAVFVFFADLGLSPYSVREMARQRDLPSGLDRTNVLYGNLLSVRLLLSLATATMIIGAAWLSQRPPVMTAAIALSSLGLIVYGVQGASDAVLAGYERLDISAGAKVLNQLVFVLVGGVALWLGSGYYGLIMANLAGVALMSLFCWSAVSRLRVHPRRPVVRSWPVLLRASVPFGVIGFSLGLSYKFDSVLLSIFRGDAETGYYNAVYNLVFSAVVLSNVFNTALYPSIARRSATAPHLLPGIYGRALKYLISLALPIAVGTWGLADPLVTFLFTKSYMPAIPALQIVIWVAPLMFASEFLGYVVVVQGNEQRVARAVLISTGFNVALNLVVVPRLGFLGAAVMTVVTEGVLVGQYVWLLRSLLRQLDWGQVLFRPLLAAVLMGLVVLTLSDLPLLVDVALGASVYGGLLLALGVLGKDEYRLVLSFFGPACRVREVTKTMS